MTLENFIYESVSEILNGGYEEVKKDIAKINTVLTERKIAEAKA